MIEEPLLLHRALDDRRALGSEGVRRLIHREPSKAKTTRISAGGGRHELSRSHLQYLSMFHWIACEAWAV